MVEQRNIVENEKRNLIIQVLRDHQTSYVQRVADEKEVFDWTCSCAGQSICLPSWDDCREQTNRHWSDEILRALHVDRSGKLPQAISIAILRDHWPTVLCNHPHGTDDVGCSCGRFGRKGLPNVGGAVQAWIDHIAEVQVKLPPVAED